MKFWRGQHVWCHTKMFGWARGVVRDVDDNDWVTMLAVDDVDFVVTTADCHLLRLTPPDCVVAALLLT